MSTLFYLGKVRYAPGTFASLVTAILWYVFWPINIEHRLSILFVLFILAYFSTYISLKFFEDKDPQCIVIDEALGMSIPLVFLSDSLILFFVSFLLFRIFDILKPSIVYYVQDLNGTNGVLMDDVLAGILTLFITLNFAW